ncbi:uncharacterized protein RB166_017325 isoform 1-T2 [Leptodactylus fuscus]
MKTDMLVLLIALSLCALYHLGYGDTCLATALQSSDPLKNISALLEKYNYTLTFMAFYYDAQQAMGDLKCDINTTLTELGVLGATIEAAGKALYDYFKGLVPKVSP